MLLKIDNLDVCYGKHQVISKASLALEEGESVCLLGPNGAGKSTLCKTIVGMVKPRAGTIEFAGKTVNTVSTEQRIALGMALVPEGRHLFPSMTVWENLDLGGYVRRGDKAGLAKSYEDVFELFPILKERRGQRAGTLSGGEQQMLAIGRALMTQPKLLLLDEPSLALAPKLVETLFEAIGEINRRGITLLVVEQNAAMAFTISKRAYVLELGEIALQGTSEELEADERVRRAYLGI